MKKFSVNLAAVLFMICAAVLGPTPAWSHGDDEAGDAMQMVHEAGASQPSTDSLIPEIIPNWHPIFVHFSVALLFTATALFVLGKIAPVSAAWRPACLTAARWNLALGVAITTGTVLAGWYAFNTVNHDGHSHLAMLSHRNWALATTASFLALGAWGLIGRKAEPHGLFVTGLVAASVLLSVTGYKGGELVFRHGLGVMAMPESDSHHHQP